MRICLLADAQSLHTVRWCAFFSERGYDVHLLSFRAARVTGASVYTFDWGDSLSRARYLLYSFAIRRLVRRLCPDILHAHHATSYGLVGALTGWHPYLVHTWGRDVLDFPDRALYRMLVRFNLRQADLITCTSQEMARAARRLSPPTTPIHVVPFGVDLTHFRPRAEPKPTTAPLVIGLVRPLARVYGIETLLQAFAALYTPNSSLQLLIVGDGDWRPTLESLACELGVAQATRFVGRVPHDQVIDHLHQMDIFVMPSLQEGFGVAAVEAAAAGLPVVASNVGGLPEVVMEGETGYLVPPADVEALTSRLAQLAADPDLRQRMGVRGRAFVAENFNWQVNATQMEHIYQSLIEG